MSQMDFEKSENPRLTTLALRVTTLTDEQKNQLKEIWRKVPYRNLLTFKARKDNSTSVVLQLRVISKQQEAEAKKFLTETLTAVGVRGTIVPEVPTKDLVKKKWIS